MGNARAKGGDIDLYLYNQTRGMNVDEIGSTKCSRQWEQNYSMTLFKDIVSYCIYFTYF